MFFFFFVLFVFDTISTLFVDLHCWLRRGTRTSAAFNLSRWLLLTRVARIQCIQWWLWISSNGSCLETLDGMVVLCGLKLVSAACGIDFSRLCFGGQK